MSWTNPWRRQRGKPWMGKYHVGHLCVPCTKAFWWELEVLQKYQDGHKQVEKSTQKICDSCMDYIKKHEEELGIVDYELV